ncbi:MAG: biosynthetic-type acetolactate synthase large subunit [Dehalococcoidia bacterium]
MRLKGAQILCECLRREGVEVIFGFPGGTVIPLYDALPHYPELRHVLVRHEQGAAHAADGYARATGKVGVCLATSGPGATNLVTGIASAYLDSSPMVAITGQVARQFIGLDAFQEVDITGITLPITKHNYLVMEGARLAEAVHQAFFVARSGRPGPVLLDIPRDVFVEEATYDPDQEYEFESLKSTLHGHAAQVKKAAHLLNEARRPVILAGRGVIISGACREMVALAERAQVPVVNTLLGLGSIPQSHFLSLGMLGMHGNAYANKAVSQADLIIALGMRFDDRATGNVSGFAPGARIVHIDIDPAEIGKCVRVDVPIVGDAARVLEALAPLVHPGDRREWLQQIEQWRVEHPNIIPDGAELAPQFVVRQIWEATGGDAIIVTGVGQNQMWAAQNFSFHRPDGLISSGGLGAMGFELPAALGAKIGRPQDTVWCIAGDGGFQMTVQELGTIVQEGAAVKIAIINNGFLGMVRQWQELFYHRRYVGTQLSGPDFVQIARAYGIPGERVTERLQVRPAIERAMAHPGPYLIDFVVEPEENVYPMVPPGASLSEFIEGPRKVARAPASSLGVSNV